ncbi:MAG: CAP domain-containing protein [Actinomycetota bacterium]
MAGARALSRGASTVIAVVALVALVASMVVYESSAGAGESRYRLNPMEKCMIKKIDGARKRHGLRRLDTDKQIAYVARRHARTMARRNVVFDDANLPSKVTRWRSLAANDGEGLSCKRTFKALMHDSAHRANILGPYNFVGVGTHRRGNWVFVSQIFEWRRNPGNRWHYP